MAKTKAQYKTASGHESAARKFDAAAQVAAEAGNNGQAAFARRSAELHRRQAAQRKA